MGESVENPIAYFDNNLLGTINLLAMMDEHEVDKLVFSSSATVYGNSSQIPLSEDLKRSTYNPYARTKMMIEDILQDVADSNPKWKIVSLRYFNPLGPHSSGQIGEAPNGVPNNLAPYITLVAVGKLEKLSIFGTDYNTPDGTCIRDYVHVCDLAKGHTKAIDFIDQTPNIGHPIPKVVTKRRPGDIDISIADTTKAKELLDWELPKGLVRWFFPILITVLI